MRLIIGRALILCTFAAAGPAACRGGFI